MRSLRSVALLLLLGPTLPDASGSEAETPPAAEIRAAVERSLPLLTRAARGSMEQRARCFTCHHQGLPIMALALARSRGLPIEEAEWRRQIQFTADFLERNRSGYLEGKGQGGQADTAGYALWSLERAAWPPDATTAAVVEYLLRWQSDRPHWQPQSKRPPTEQSLFTSTHVALRGLEAFGAPAQRERIERRRDRAREWLLATPARDTEDRVFRLRALVAAGAPEEAIDRTSAELRESRRPDGGWAQLEDMASDAYATGTALAALHEAGGVGTDDPVYRAGLRYLLDGQLADGSWRVATRSRPIQAYFESGYPHGPDQFISISAAAWSTMALTLALPAALPAP